MNVTIKCQTLYILCEVCQRYIRTSHRLFLTARAPKIVFKGLFATEPTPIKQHTRAEKRKEVQRAPRKLAVSVSEF